MKRHTQYFITLSLMGLGLVACRSSNLPASQGSNSSISPATDSATNRHASSANTTMHAPQQHQKTACHTSSTHTNGPPKATRPRSLYPFRVSLKDVTPRTSIRNFIMVTIRPQRRLLRLQDFLVTATLLNNIGTVMGSSRKGSQGNLYYQNDLQARSLASIFLTNVNCLGKNDTSFAQGQPISFRIMATQTNPIEQHDTHTVSLEIACISKENAHSSKQFILLAGPRRMRKQPQPPQQVSH